MTSKQRQFLKGLAHTLEPVVRIGRGGVTDAVVEETKKSLVAHELIKVRIDTGDSSARKTIAGKLAEATSSEIAGAVGKIAILYRERDEKPAIKLPR